MARVQIGRIVVPEGGNCIHSPIIGELFCEMAGTVDLLKKDTVYAIVYDNGEMKLQELGPSVLETSRDVGQYDWMFEVKTAQEVAEGK